MSRRDPDPKKALHCVKGGHCRLRKWIGRRPPPGKPKAKP